MVVDAWWFALLFAVPSILDPTPVEFGMRSLAFSGYYWLACCVFVGAALAPRVAAHIGGRAFAGRRGRFVRAACIALASMWFCASSVLAISARCLGAVDAYAVAASLHGIWKVTSIGSMIACAVHMHLRAAHDQSVGAPSRALLVVLLTCSVCIGFCAPPRSLRLCSAPRPWAICKKWCHLCLHPSCSFRLVLSEPFCSARPESSALAGCSPARGGCARERSRRACVSGICPTNFSGLLTSPSSPWGWSPRRLRLALLLTSGDERSQGGVAASSVLPALP